MFSLKMMKFLPTKKMKGNDDELEGRMSPSVPFFVETKVALLCISFVKYLSFNAPFFP